MNPLIRPKIKQVTVTVEMEDGRTHITESRPGAITNEGVTILDDQKIDAEFRMDPDAMMVDMERKVTVTWVEQWTEMTR